MVVFGSAPFLYPIVDTGLCASRGVDPEAVAAAYYAGGARVVQLRCKSDSSAEFLTIAGALVRLARACGGALIVNDRADVALLSRADGVHVGQEDLSVADARRIVGEAAIVGVSTHDERQVDEALRSSATYVAVGPIFGTATKDTGYTARGLDLVRYGAARGKPIVAIGGITLENARSVIEAGASGIAVISDLLSADPAARARAFLRSLPTASR